MPQNQAEERNTHRRNVLQQLQGKFLDLRNSYPEGHTQLLFSIMRGWFNWEHWPADIRESLIDMVRRELVWLIEDRHHDTVDHPAPDFESISRWINDHSSEIINDVRIAELFDLPIYTEGQLRMRAAE
ncbi:hypothetical protein [Noviherbaspirillum malthae]|uniref:hypothetical protein n=1 Tax=Noviherbaspirillum malthae TaxID=1260987 RepID=UPI00188FC4D5|nr:hypothetical protein [Noviherbaspirillum malthae]